MDSLYLRIVLLVALFVISLIFGLIPLPLLRYLDSRDSAGRRSKRWSDIGLSSVSCVCGGIFLGTCFLHLLPEAREAHERLEKEHGWPEFPIGETIACLGFFLTFFVEELAMWILKRKSIVCHEHSGHQKKDSLNKESNGCDYEVAKCNESATGTIALPDEKEEEEEAQARKLGAIKSLTLVGVISLHSVLEGLAIGIQTKTSSLMTLFVAVLSHKCLIALSIGLQVSRANNKKFKIVFICMILFAAMSPLGAAIGIGVDRAGLEAHNNAILFLVFTALSVGTFLYVTFFEIINREMANPHSNMMKFTSMLLGFIIIGTVTALSPHEE